MNEIKILGAYGTKAKGAGTSSFYLNERNVIDAGNLLNTLEEESAKIENIWLTHSHLDHICDIAYILDNYFSIRNKTLNIIGLPATIKAVKKHFLNDLIWPDFSRIPMHASNEMTVAYIELVYGAKYKIGDDEYITPFKTDHTVPSCGYVYKKNSNSVLITADTYSLDTAIKILESQIDIKSMILECSFPSSMDKLAKESKHLTPKLLFEKLDELKRDDIELYINHVKPLFLEKITQEIELLSGKWVPKILKDNEIIYF
ncbi:hypothetical protein KKC15_02945 [bacterium]|nr:hypothetical protein [bacterium]